VCIHLEKKKKQIVISVVVIGIVFGGVFGAFGIMSVALNTSTPVVVVTSGSMVPTLYEGDILFIQNVSFNDLVVGNHTTRTGDIIVYSTQKPYFVTDVTTEPIVHRLVGKYFDNTTGRWYVQTWGDANSIPDMWNAPAANIMGKVVGVIPYLGWIKILLDQTGLAIPLLVFLAALLVISILWDISNPKKQAAAAAEQAPGEEPPSRTGMDPE